MGTDIHFINAAAPKPQTEATGLFMEALSDVGATLEPEGYVIRTADGGNVSWSGIDDDASEGTVTIRRFFSPEVSRLLYTVALKTEWAMFISLGPGYVLRPVEHMALPVTRDGFDPLPDAVEGPQALHLLLLEAFQKQEAAAAERLETLRP